MNEAFDTLAAARDLEAAGIERKQAEKIAETIRTVQGDLATIADIAGVKTNISAVETELKADIAGVKTNISAVETELKADIAGVKTNISAVEAELKADIAGVKTELKAGIAGVKTELKADIAGVKTELGALKWLIGFMAALLIAVAARVFQLL